MSNIEQVKVFIDPGHGTPDPGAVSAAKLNEKDVVLNIAKIVQTRLQSFGTTTQMSRTGDAALNPVKKTDLDARVTKSNAFKPAIFVSIHNNAAVDKTVTGIETLVHPTASSYNNQLAKKVNDTLVAQLGMKNRGVKLRDDVRVIYPDNNAWAILVEIGFLSNVAEAASLGTASVQQKAGYAIADSIKSWINSLPPM